MQSYDNTKTFIEREREREREREGERERKRPMGLHSHLSNRDSILTLSEGFILVFAYQHAHHRMNNFFFLNGQG